MATIPPVNLDTLHNAILSAIRSAFPVASGGFATVDDYPREVAKVAGPAFFLDFAEAEIGTDGGTRQLAIDAHFEGLVVVSAVNTKAARRQVRSLACAVAQFIFGNRWGQPVSPAEVTGIRPEAFHPELDLYEVWRVEWSQRLLQGVSLYAPSGAMPTDILVGTAPYVGPPNVDAYQDITP